MHEHQPKHSGGLVHLPSWKLFNPAPTEVMCHQEKRKVATAAGLVFDDKTQNIFHVLKAGEGCEWVKDGDYIMVKRQPTVLKYLISSASADDLPGNGICFIEEKFFCAKMNIEGCFEDESSIVRPRAPSLIVTS